MDPLLPYAAVVLAGGRAERLGGQAKPQLRVGGRTLLATVLDAVADARPRVVVGPAQEVPDDVLLMREAPPGGGPVAALRAGLEHVHTPTVVVLAADLPFLTAGLVRELRRRVRRDGALVVDDTGRDQFLLGAWRTAALRTAVTDPAGPRALHRVVSALDVDRWSPPVEPGRPGPWLDCDTPEQLAWARAVAGGPPG
ncbi:molybdenum cofactor guanylyltransferase [Blastococcus sp. MG754426]|uniref:molybdenum cofactor guanylyltransferase n=1 Tax=unclassified Blastococcus TaxID=2619396 RepID=UPI001EF15B4D|nr:MULTISPECIES: NTP transferase domain-containing protein [unclassified Blastococcus]MCF6507100.1 molybdenum cofactor guanylyltransferase [Blastococcus sp. MG754426]MCF6511772.1 molybdenum cofactor guanylyltransferase [Blastococcus sp. MG754427]MCF6734702.1 molybdenum cofactor guanylyltransferase [Blastococcus sp. KM273129]